MAEQLEVLGLCGSFRKGSFNRKALRAAQKLAPPEMRLVEHDLRPIPFYDADVEAEGFPAPVEALREAARRADGILLVTPEYNHSFTAIIKNAVDWISRPPDQAWADKPVAIMSASPSLVGGIRAQIGLRQCFVGIKARVLGAPEVIITHANTKFDEVGELTDEATAKLMRQMLGDFAVWIRRIQASRGV
jgi:chromate reductase